MPPIDHDDTLSASEGMGGTPSLGLGLGLELARRRAMERFFGAPAEPLKIGRYLVEAELGSGGMGTVWRAFDGVLHRPVALKFLRGGGGAGLEGGGRLVEEAQALARLSHPNVVPVYDVGEHEGRVWLAMELVEGQTLLAWVTSEGPSVRQRLRAWIDAGRGLAAVHEVGLVHRDVKPDNVLMGADGRVRLLDFGLVRSRGRSLEGASTRDGSERRASLPAQDQRAPTQEHAFVGTPRYAAPEQRHTAWVGAEADQYAFCVALYEALFGVLPQGAPLDAGASLPLPPGAGRGVPRRVRAALARGLCRDPGGRHPDMGALLVALEGRPVRTLVGWTMVGALAVGALAGLVGARSLGPVASEATPCVEAARAVEGWPARRAALVEVLDGPRAAPALAFLDSWVEAWAATAQRSCEEVHVEGLRSEDSLDRRRACLDASLGEFDVVVSGLEGDPSRLALIWDWTRDLSLPESCLSEAVLAKAPLSPEQARRVDALRRELFSLGLDVQGQPLAERRARVEAILEQGEAAEFGEVRARALELRVVLARIAGDEAAARRGIGRLFDEREGPWSAQLQARAWLELTRLELELEPSVDADEAEWTAARYQGSLADLSWPTREQARARMLSARVAFARGRPREAVVELRAAVEGYAELGAAGEAEKLDALRNLAVVLGALDSPELPRVRRRIEALARELGEGESSDRCTDAALDATTSVEAGELERGRAQAEAALGVCREADGGRSLNAAYLHALLALVGLYEGKLDDALGHALAADQGYREVWLEDADAHALSLSTLATVRFHRDGPAAAVDDYRRALALAEASAGFEPSERELLRANLAEALFASGQAAAARPMLRRALRELGPDEPRGAVPRKVYSAVLLELGEVESAWEQIEPALAQLAEDANAVELADARFIAARIAGEEGRKGEARAFGEAALEDYRKLGADFEEQRSIVEAWLDGGGSDLEKE
ncbi:serine/threonine kinase family protein [Plesiocystis pacifica SIR-1]|uniref:Serine/threonine kinase family protein n=1 Tax=Plesiocystis pacifica SIR-1 TaxID=391625 RepID=A6GD50_9BACT|nr:serine/threonine-protein kinase [Plesiocystis pacifica]EDM76208.1 serine/threonine kinase family protein [Plesiocystis pacifica SIR-1]